MAAKAVGLASALGGAGALGPRARPFDLALGHGSNDVTVAARLLRIPRSTMFDYESATVQHTVNCRLAQAVVVPEVIPPERLARYGARGSSALPGAEGGVLPRRLRARPRRARRAGPRPSQPLAVMRTPPASRCTTASRTTSSPRSSTRVRGTQVVVLPRTPSSAPSSTGFIVPERAIDAQSLIASPT